MISLSGVAVEFGATPLLRDVTVTIAPGDRWGIIGRNGSGKTTLFRLMLGDQQPTRGGIARAPGLKFAVLDQHRDFGEATTVWDAAAEPFAHLIALEQSLHDQAVKLGDLGERATQQMIERYGHDQERFAHEGGYTFHSRVDATLHGLGFDHDEAKTRPITHLSGGERGRLGLVRQLVAPADVLLLDEPTNHLDLETAAWLEEYLRQVDETVLVISHDRAFLDRVVDHVLHVDDMTATPYTGDYTAFAMQRAERRLSQQRAFEQQQKTVAKEEDYIRRNLAGQNTKQAKGRRKKLERLPRLSAPSGEGGVMSLRLESSERGGDRVAEFEKLGVSVPTDEGERTLLEKFTATIRRGDVIGFIGPNGSGKTTLLKTLMGERPPTTGNARLGGSITPAYYRQDLAQIPMDKTLYEIINDLRPLWSRGAVQNHLGAFGFSGDSVRRYAGTLSGGERARVALAMIVLSHANLLVLDEPTNHLDVESIEALEDAVDGYEGTTILVSHDRALLRALVTRVWSLDGTHITDFDGTFAEWEIVRAEKARAAAADANAAEKRTREKEREQSKKGGSKETKGARQQADGDRKRAKRAAETAEQEVATREARVAELVQALEDPALYAGAGGNGVKRAATLTADLAKARRALDDAVATWVSAAAAADEASA
ncbi:MAG: ABC-F family ATP-binding cassette domain-containing protein [Gemmatimonadaceae bacterium]